MKKVWLILLVLLVLTVAAGCGKEDADSGAAVLTDNGDGTMTALDTTGSPLDGGLNITVDKNEGFVNMQITDESGEDTVEFFKFTPADSICQRHRYVSMMGTGFYYFFDYEVGAMVRIEDMDNQDVTKSTKEQGRFDSAQSDTKEMVDQLTAYFSDTYGMTIDEAVK